MTLPEIQAAQARTPVAKLLGLALTELAKGAATLSFPVGPSHAQEGGVVHGGLLATAADTACVYALRPEVNTTCDLTSIEFKLNFLRAARTDGGPVTAHAKVVRSGRKVGVVEVDLHQDGEHLAKGLYTYLFFEPR